MLQATEQEFRVGQMKTDPRFDDESEALRHAQRLANERDEPVSVWLRMAFKPWTLLAKVEPQ